MADSVVKYDLEAIPREFQVGSRGENRERVRVGARETPRSLVIDGHLVYNGHSFLQVGAVTVQAHRCRAASSGNETMTFATLEFYEPENGSGRDEEKQQPFLDDVVSGLFDCARAAMRNADVFSYIATGVSPDTPLYNALLRSGFEEGKAVRDGKEDSVLSYCPPK